MAGCIAGVPGVLAGHATDRVGMTGCTVVLCPGGVPAAVEVRGSAPGTRETDLLRPTNLVEEVHAVLLAGGSAFGLEADGGLVRYLEERGWTSTPEWPWCRWCRLPSSLTWAWEIPGRGRPGHGKPGLSQCVRIPSTRGMGGGRKGGGGG